MLDGRRRPVGIVETLGVETVRFRDVTTEMASAYGDGERTLGWWRRAIGGWYRDKAARDGQLLSEGDEVLWGWTALVRRLRPGSEPQ